MPERLVPINTNHPKLRSLGICHRIEIEHPLLVRESISTKLIAAADQLPNHLQLQIDSAYRSRETQEKIFKAREKQLGKKKTSKLVFDPQKGVPPHSTGGAVDVTLTNKHGIEINLSAPFPKYYQEPQLRSKNISPEAQQLRLLLHNVMTAQEFAPHPNEFWHFSYGDQMWANHYHKNPLFSEVPKNNVPTYHSSIIHLVKLCKIIQMQMIKLGLRKRNY
ncbi:hypothetical protein A2415_05345 [candidate division WWE3 bacterium RIFOXYC1_FULL_39_7]|uniref:D-Ala-D-Ala dipeptidase n=1 Tax=candidate division WWE3 bacterium RIFOXYC1_FULL_39_7 TaxID=1802643 RepID=A0A1F4WJB8_UNCKA|nr:MAG: hypothetical protein A2415_05345 [candidate division WWE3 bacterium RIFOXYC1_FULL_39_7]